MKQFLDKFFLLRAEVDPGLSRGRKALYWAWRLGLLICAGVCLGAVMLIFAYGQYPWGVFLGYLHDPEILVLNILPVLLMVFLFYGLLGRCWAAFLAGGLLSLGFSLGNYFKLSFRDDPLYFEDMLILREARNMADSYALFVDKRIVFAAGCILLGTAALALLARGRLRRRGRGTALLSVALAGVLLWPAYMDAGRYNAIENFSSLNRWSATQNYISRGFFYPFVHSVGEFIVTPPEGYSDAKAEDLLAAYADRDIPEEKKVNVIALMRESYVDFSQYGIPGLDGSGYDLYHALEEESYTGTLTNIFAGGTIDTERCFLTGNYQLRNFRGDVSSYLWYLRDQGYTVEGSHPYYKWFYNRQNVNGYMGFEDYRYLEGDYDQLTRAYLPEDSVLLPEIYGDFQANKATGKPYFNFSLNIQSHGPYAVDSYGGEVQYLTGDYSDGCKNAMNNYMAAIMDSDRELMELVDQLRADPEPVVLLTFGDHLPWMGDSSVFYEEMGMRQDMDAEEGLRQHYSTEYLIWANDAAKEVLGNDFVGEGPTISPCYLMNLVFEQCSWEGPAFLQAMDDMLAVFPVVSIHGFYVVDGQFTDAIPEERQELFRKFQYLQHYWQSEFLFD